MNQESTQCAEAATLARYCIVPEWKAPANVRALMTTRDGGVSVGARATLDLGGDGSRDGDVLENRRRLRALLPGHPHWLHQVHGSRVVRLDVSTPADTWPEADASVTSVPGVVCAVRVADCLPVLLADTDGRCVAAAHAGWRGLAHGVIEAAIAAMRDCGSHSQIAWLGAAIGPSAFEVGDEVRDALCANHADAQICFRRGTPGKWHADLYALATRRLRALGIAAITGGGYCTRTQADRFFSYRRDRDTGRMAALVWLT